MPPSDEEVAAQLLAFFLAAPRASDYADGVSVIALSRALRVGMRALKVAVRNAPADFALVQKKVQHARPRRSTAYVVCLSPVFNSQVRPAPGCAGVCV